MGLTEYGKIIRRWWWLPVLGALLVASAGYAVSARQQPQYLASSRLLVNQVQSPGPSSYNDLLTSEKLAMTYTQLLQSPSLLDDTIKQVGLPIDAATLKKRTTVSVVRATQLIEISVWDYDANRAAATANALAQLFVKRAQDLQTSNSQVALQQVDSDIDALQKQINDTSQRLDQLRAGISANTTTTQQITQLQAQITQYDQDLRTLRQQSADASGRLNSLKTGPDAATNGAEIQRLQDQLNQYDQDTKDIQTRSTDATNRLAQLRATPASGTTQADTQRLQDQLAQYQTKYGRLLDTRQSIVLAQVQGGAAVVVADQARVPTVPIAPQPRRNALLGGAIGLLLLAALALLLDFRDDRIHELEEVPQQFNAPLLGVLGASRGNTPLMLTNPEIPNIAAFREALRHVRTTTNAALPAGAAAICVSSARPGEGKSVVAANLALLEAQAGKRVLLIDANVREPRLHKLLGIRNNQGLSAYLAQTQHGNQPKFQAGPLGITVLTAGWVLTNLPDLLGSARMVNLIADLRQRYDLIILDTAPVLSFPDTLALQQTIDGTVLVTDVRRTRTRVVERALASLRQVSGQVVGIVLTKDRKRAGVYGSSRSLVEDSGDDAVIATDETVATVSGEVSASA